MTRLGNSYVVTAVSAWALIVGAVVAFVMLVSLQGLTDWPGSGLGIDRGGAGGSNAGGSANTAVARARAIGQGATGIAAGVATRTPATATPAGTGGRRHSGGTGGTEANGAGEGTPAVSPASAITAPVQSPPSKAGGNEVAAPEGGGAGTAPTAGGGGGESGGAPLQTASTAPPSSRSTSPETGFGNCEMQGEARFSPGLGSSSRAFSYELTGSLERCRSSQTGTPATGTLSAGAVLSEQVTNSLTGATETVEYQEPMPVGSGSCEGSTTVGEGLETWEDGTRTVVSYSTTGALAATQLSGSVAPSMTLIAVNPAPGDPATFTIDTTRYAGESVVGLLFFQPTDPAACTRSPSVTTTTVSGFFGLGGS